MCCYVNIHFPLNYRTVLCGRCVNKADGHCVFLVKLFSLNGFKNSSLQDPTVSFLSYSCNCLKQEASLAKSLNKLHFKPPSR